MYPFAWCLGWYYVIIVEEIKSQQTLFNGFRWLGCASIDSLGDRLSCWLGCASIDSLGDRLSCDCFPCNSVGLFSFLTIVNDVIQIGAHSSLLSFTTAWYSMTRIHCNTRTYCRRDTAIYRALLFWLKYVSLDSLVAKSKGNAHEEGRTAMHDGANIMACWIESLLVRQGLLQNKASIQLLA
jgi:hypothetical protein